MEPGTVHALMGKNGSGKSSLAYTLLGFPAYQMMQGSMHYNGKNLHDMTMHERSRAGIFLAFQQPVTIPGVSVFQFLKEIYSAAGHPLQGSDFLNFVHACCDKVGLDYALLYRSLHENFSGGEKKRVEILQMLLLQPQCIILDEIDSGLDVDALKAIGTAVVEYLAHRPDAICLVITHYCRILQYIKPSHVHIMHQGKIVRSADAALAHYVEEYGYDEYT
jgi:Fe-S cluster assembly ATP-binding protein